MLINDRKIYMSASRPSELDAGLELQKKKKVKSIHFNNAKKTILGEVEDLDLYHTVITFNGQNNIEEIKCNCGTSTDRHRGCRHAIATLKQAQILIEKSKNKQLILEKTIHDMINNFSETIYNDTMVKIPVKIEIYLEPETYRGESVLQLTLKVGIDKMYVVKNIKEFIYAFDQHEEIEFGKSFVLNPIYQCIPKDYEDFIDLLKDFYETNNYNSINYKSLILTQKQIKKVLKTLTNQMIYYKRNQNNTLVQTYITDEILEGLLKLDDQNETITLNLSEFKKIEPVTQDYEFIFYDYQIYHLSPALIKRYHPFIQAATQAPSIQFKGKNRQDFIAKVIPYLPEEVEIPDTIKDSYIQLPFEASLYLDKQDQMIMATPIFKYGNYEFNPIEVKEDNILLNHRILIREIKKEEELMNIFDNAKFKVQPKFLYIDKEEDVIHFVEKYLPLLHSNMEIFYSDQFKTIVKKRSLSSSIRYNEETQLFEIDFQFDDLSLAQIKELLNSYKLKQKYFRLKDGSFISLDDKKTIDFLNSLDYLDIDYNELASTHLDLTLSQAMFLNSNYDIDQSDHHFDEMIQTITSHDYVQQVVPEHLKATLRDYQINGYSWLKMLNQFHLGGILADDMGLGKTLQTITFLYDEIQQNNQPNLIICPTSLVYNWEEEIKKFAPSIRYLIVSGSIQRRKEKIDHIKDYQLIITSYPLLKKDIEYYKNIHFNHCFLDEAQYIKNPTSQNARSVKLIRANTRYALTGTPMENSLDELWSIFDFIMPGMLLSHNKFRKLYEIPIIKGKDKQIKRKLMNRIKPFILRRMKTEVLSELPDKIESKYTIELTQEQKNLYVSTLETMRQSLNKDIEKDGFEKSQLKILTALTRLRQLCNHPSLYIQNYYGSSGKLDALNEIIDEALQNNHKILIFSQFTSMLHIIEDQLKIKEIPYVYLDGNTPMEQRVKYVKNFNEGDTPIFLVSLKAGGTGLNLTGANMVIHVDPWWNPAVEQQATDRAYRIGQTKNVQVIKLVTKGTIEEKIYDLQQQKISLIDSIIQPGETFINKLTKEEVIDLFK